MEQNEEKKKTSNEILIELFEAFNSEPPQLDETKRSRSSHKKSKKSKKSKKKKSKKHKKKSSGSNSDVSDDQRKSKKAESKIEVPLNEIPQALDILLHDTQIEPASPTISIPLPKEFEKVPPDKEIKSHRDDVDDDGISLNKENIDNKIVEEKINGTELSPQLEKPTDTSVSDKKKGKIQIINLKNSAVFQETVRAVEEIQKKEQEKKSKYEEGELSDSSNGSSSNKDDEEAIKELSKRRRKRSRSRSRTGSKLDKGSKRSRKDSPGRSSHHSKRSRSRESHHSSRHSSSHHKSTSYRSERSERHHSPHSSSRSRSRRTKERSTSRLSSERKRHSESGGHKSKEKQSDRGKSQENSRDPDKIDKKKLLAIARKNALKLIDAGIVSADKLPSIASGGKTVNELTEYCKKISKKEAMGDDLSDIESVSTDEDDKAFHHPFQVRDRPNSIVMNIKNATPLPVKSFHEKSIEQSKQLRLQFPVSSGSTHRLTESEWVPVEPEKEQPKKAKPSEINLPPTPAFTTAVPPLAPPPMPPPLQPPPMPPAALTNTLLPSATSAYTHLSAVPPPLLPTPDIPVIQPATNTESPASLDINSIVTKRLNALRKLQENPKDSRAKQQISHTELQLGKWTKISRQQDQRRFESGAFTGSTGARILSAAELGSGTQAWAKRDQLLTAQPVRGGMGMALLQKMGWQPGEGLGKNKEGTLEPLRLEVKTDKKGLVATDEAAWKGRNVGPALPTVKTLDGKHPVSVLNEYCSRRHWAQPVFEMAEEFGPDHKKNFLIKVRVNGVEYQPSVASVNKKQAKAEAAAICLRALGLISNPTQ